MVAVNEDGTPVRAVPMKVIVAGLHRTGSMSMRTALRMLGFNDTYHMKTNFENVKTDPAKWTQAINGKYTNKRAPFTKDEWDDLLGNSQACVDLPVAIFSCELAEIYPDAKVVILNRDPEKWYVSVLNTVYRFMSGGTFMDKVVGMYAYALDPDARNMFHFAKALNLALGFEHKKEKAKAIAWYNEQYAEFRRRIPAERRMEFKVQDGWQPLCEFLDVPVPMVEDPQTGKMVEAPFPRVNDTASITKGMKSNRRNRLAKANEHLMTLLGRLTVYSALGYGGYLAWKTRLGGRL